MVIQIVFKTILSTILIIIKKRNAYCMSSPVPYAAPRVCLIVIKLAGAMTTVPPTLLQLGPR